MRVLGIDPGISGALALIEFQSGGANRPSIIIEDLPVIDGHIDYRRYRDRVRDLKPDKAYIENVWPRPVGSRGGGMGFNTAGKFMRTTGGLEAITACEVGDYGDCIWVTPVVWQRMFGLLGQGKNAARKLLVDLFPETEPLVRRVKDDGRADAGLIASYGAVKQKILNLEMAWD